MSKTHKNSDDRWSGKDLLQLIRLGSRNAYGHANEPHGLHLQGEPTPVREGVPSPETMNGSPCTAKKDRKFLNSSKETATLQESREE